MIREAELLADLHPKIVVKIPMIPAGIKAIHYLSSKNIRTNCTLVFSAGQALVAAKAGATYVSPFVGRLDDILGDGLQLVAQIKAIFNNYDFPTQILAASIRNPMHIIQCAEIGADIVTAPLSCLLSLMKHPLTDSGLAQFIEDFEKGNKK
jgi:transaldolase